MYLNMDSKQITRILGVSITSCLIMFIKKKVFLNSIISYIISDMNQNIWGPHMWFSLHTISFNYPIKPTENDKYYYKNYFNSLQHVIPCSVCKRNYIRHLNELPIDKAIENRKSLVYWVIDLHNLVNSETGKKNT
jgi:hypothetical protein